MRHSLFPFAGSTALVTGASSGIGATFAEALARRGTSLVLVARSQSVIEARARELAERYGITAEAIAADLSDVSARDALIDRLANRRVDLLVNNAGAGHHGRFVEMDVKDEIAIVELNCAAIVHLSGALVPAMVERGAGAVLNVASTAAYQPTPNMATYGATKAFVLSFSVALASELRKSSVRVLAFCPGPVRTNFGAATGDSDFAHRYFSMAPAPEAIVPAALEALDRKRTVVIAGTQNRVGAFSSRLAPYRISAAIAGRVLRSR